jgi:hypothetical protein
LAALSVAGVILAVVLLAAGLAPGLVAVSSVPTVKLAQRLLDAAVLASLHCQIRLHTVADGANKLDMALLDTPHR